MARIFALGTLCLFIVVVLSAAPQDKRHAQHTSVQPVGARPGASPTLSAARERQIDPTNKIKKKNVEERWDWSVIASVTNAVTSILLVFFGALGWHVVSRQLDEMKESNRTSREHHETLSRPWLLALTIDGPKQICQSDQARLSVEFKFKNTGSTPAIIESAATSWEITDRGHNKRIPLVEQGSSQCGSAICLPGDFFHLPIHAHLPASITLEAMSEGRLILIVHGEVIYSDCFDKRRSTKFGMQYGRFFHDSDTPDWQACGEYNAIT